MPLSQLIYASCNHKKLSISDIKLLVTKAASDNKLRQISGFMCANRDFFLQCLEGEDAVVDDLFKTIRTDKRHSKVMLLSCKSIDRRSFPDWGMGVVTKLETHKQLLRELNHSESFDPFRFENGAELVFLIALYNIQHGRSHSPP